VSRVQGTRDLRARGPETQGPGPCPLHHAMQRARAAGAHTYGARTSTAGPATLAHLDFAAAAGYDDVAVKPQQAVGRLALALPRSSTSSTSAAGQFVEEAAH
jgi:hypothetical protein